MTNDDDIDDHDTNIYYDIWKNKFIQGICTFYFIAKEAAPIVYYMQSLLFSQSKRDLFIVNIKKSTGFDLCFKVEYYLFKKHKNNMIKYIDNMKLYGVKLLATMQ